MISFAAITPHPPIIIPNIGRDNLSIVKKTVEGMKKLERAIRKVKPDTIIIISPHGHVFQDAFSFNLSEIYTGSFRAFGDIENKLKFFGDIESAHRLFERLETAIPLTMITNPELDHGSLVPLYYLTKNLKKSLIIPLGYSFLSNQEHLCFGEQLCEELIRSHKKFAIIASGDLSHRLTFDAPAGYHEQGKIFDDKIVSLLKRKSLKQILEIDSELIKNAGECGLRSILILLGIIKDLNCKPELISYEGPFGVGYLIMNFIL